PFRGRYRRKSSYKVPLGFDAWVIAGAKFPARPAVGNPGRCCTGVDQAIPAFALRVVVSGKVDLTKFVPGRMNQLAQKNGKQLTSFEIIRPIVNLSGSDG